MLEPNHRRTSPCVAATSAVASRPPVRRSGDLARIAAGLLAVAAVLCPAVRAWANVPLLQLSADPFENPAAQHATEVESDNFSFGPTMVGAFQVGRYPDANAGSTDIGWTTTHDNGTTWTSGLLPGITKTVNRQNQYFRVTDPAVAFDAKHHVWLIVSLPRGTANGQTTYLVPIVSRSPDGDHWMNPVHIAPDSGDFMDKPWIVCDNGARSPFAGHCYVEYVDVNFGGKLFMSTSQDGGATWSTPVPSADGATGNGGQPVVQPNGTVLVPFLGSTIATVNSSNGGASWNASVFVANANEQPLPGGLRDPGPLPSADVDASGTAYVAWSDCSFHTNCATNDIVFSTSTNGTLWSVPVRIPTQSRTGVRDYFLPGFGVDHATGGASAHLGVTYYDLANANCSFSTCGIYVGFISSANAGTTWNKQVQIAGPMQPSWLPNSDLGYMIGDYSSTSFVGGLARSTFPLALVPVGGRLQQSVDTTVAGLPALMSFPQFSSRGERPVSRAPLPQRALRILH